MKLYDRGVVMEIISSEVEMNGSLMALMGLIVAHLSALMEQSVPRMERMGMILY
jgi:hypothetical protein